VNEPAVTKGADGLTTAAKGGAGQDQKRLVKPDTKRGRPEKKAVLP